MSKMVQYIIFRGLIHKGKDDDKEINAFFKKEGWGSVKFKTQFKTIAGNDGEGGRNDVIFKWFAEGDEIGKFSLGRFKIDGISWLGDYVNNDKNIIPPAILKKLRKMVKDTGDYEETKEESLVEEDEL